MSADATTATVPTPTLAPAVKSRRTLRSHILWLVAGLNVVSTIVACTVAYKFQKEAFLHGLDKLLVAGAISAEDYFGEDYHDRLGREEIPAAEEKKYMQRLGRLAGQLNLHYIGALVWQDGKYYYSISSSPEHELADGDDRELWTLYDDVTPALAATFADGQTRFEEHTDEYGSFRSAYVPFRRSDGSTNHYVYVADVELDYVYAELAETLWKTAFAGFVICMGSIVLCWLLANHAARPMMRLAAVIRRVIANDFSMQADESHVLCTVEEQAVAEVSDAAQAFRRMQARLCEYLRDLQESTAARERIEADLNIAHEIQMGLLPSDLPEVAGCELYARVIPAKEVGGDLFDAAVLPDGRLMIVVADVSGKGVPAGLFMAVAKTLLNVGRQYCKRPDELVSFLNRELVAHNEAMMFVTMFVGMFDPETGELQYTNAGHNPPYARRADGTIEVLEGRHGMALGISDSAEFTTERATIRDGDLLTLYSDGVTEAQNLASELFDERRLEECLTDLVDPTAANSGSELLARVAAFQGEAPQFDDITLLCLRFTASTSTTRVGGPPADALLASSLG